jgi:AcrR family transcriptional regulator
LPTASSNVPSNDSSGVPPDLGPGDPAGDPADDPPGAPADRQPSRWAGVAPADRRAERRTLLLDAAFDLLGTEGWSGTTVRAVCQAARLNPRYFYESFDDLDALVVAVYDRLVAQLGDAIVTAIAEAGDDTAAQTRAAISAIVGFVDDDRRRARVLYVEALGNEALNRRRIETGHALVAAVEQHTIDRHGPPPPGEQIGRIGAAVLVGGISELVLAWLDGRIDVARDQLVDDATALFLALGEAAARIAERRAH